MVCKVFSLVLVVINCNLQSMYIHILESYGVSVRYKCVMSTVLVM